MDRRTLYVSLNERWNIFLQQFQKSWLIVVFGVMIFVVGIFILINNEVSNPFLQQTTQSKSELN